MRTALELHITVLILLLSFRSTIGLPSLQCSDSRVETAEDLDSVISAVDDISVASGDPNNQVLAYSALSSLYQAESSLQDLATALVSGGDVDDAISQVLGNLDAADNSLASIDTSTDPNLVSSLETAQSDMASVAAAAQAMQTACE